MIERQTELKRRYHRQIKMRKLKKKLVAYRAAAAAKSLASTAGLKKKK